MGGIPSDSTCQRGLGLNCQTSVQEEFWGALRVRPSLGSMTERQETSVVLEAIFKITFPFSTRTSAVVTDSPSRSGISKTTAVPEGVRRDTFVSTSQVSPRFRRRST